MATVTGTKRELDTDMEDMENFITDNYVCLSKMLEVKPVIPYLIQDRILTKADRQRILNKVTQEDKAEELLDTLSSSGKCTPKQFINVLWMTKQTGLIDSLKSSYGEKRALLDVELPKAPDKLWAEETTTYRIKLKWEKVPDSETLLGYLVEQSPAGKEDEWKSAHEEVSVIPKGNKPQVSVGSISYQEYDFRVRAVHHIDNQRVFSDPKVLPGIVAKLPDQPYPPRNLQVQSCMCFNESNCVTLKWLEPVTIEGDSDVSYIIEKCPFLNGIIGEWNPCLETFHCECKLQDDLEVGSTYRFRVFAAVTQTTDNTIKSEPTEMAGPEIRIHVDLTQPGRAHFKIVGTDIPKLPFDNPMILMKTKEEGSVVLVFDCNDLDSVNDLWEMYKQGEVHQVLQKLFVTDDLRAQGVSPEDLAVTINPDDFKAAFKHLLLTSPTDKGFRVVRIGAAQASGQKVLGQSKEYPIYTKRWQFKENSALESLDLATSTSQIERQLTMQEDFEVSQTAAHLEHLTLSPLSPEINMEVSDTTEERECEPPAEQHWEGERYNATEDQQPSEIQRTIVVRKNSKDEISIASQVANRLRIVRDLKLQALKEDGQKVAYGRALMDAIIHDNTYMEVETLKSLGDLHLEKGKLSKDSAEFDKAAGLYAAALLRCTDLDMGETLEHRIGYMEKLSRQLLQGYTPNFLWLSADYWGTVESNTLRVAKICDKLDRRFGKPWHYVLEAYTETLVLAIGNGDTLLEVEILKSLGDLYLEKGKNTSDVSQFSKAAALYGKAVRRCEDQGTQQTLHHRILYMVKIWGAVRRVHHPQLRAKKRSRHTETTVKKWRNPKRSAVNRDTTGSFTDEDQNSQRTENQYKEHLRQGDLALQRADLDSAEQHFAAALKLIHARGPKFDRYQKEVEPLCKLGDVYSKRGQQTGDGGDFVKAAALYNAAVARSDGDVIKGVIGTAITAVENSFVVCALGIHDHYEHQQQTEKHKIQLSDIRYQIKLEMETIDKQLDPYVYDEDDPRVKGIEARRAQAVSQLFKNMALQRKQFISLLVEECIGLMGPPPCKYALIGLGSQATELVTPYSDLEFAILVEKEDEQCLEYFCNLTHYLHLKVVNLGETILPSMGIRSLNDVYSDDLQDNWFYDSVTTRGLAFDGAIPWASKTPLGRQRTKTKPRLICTPNNMVKILEKDATIHFNEVYHLSGTLRNPSLLVGEQNLVDEYVTSVVHLLKADEGQIALQLMQDILQERTDGYDKQKLTAKLINLKKEIYSFPSLAVDCCALCSQVIPTSVWNTIDEMESKCIISTDNAHHLRVLVSISAELRLKTHIANGGQNESMSILSFLETLQDSKDVPYIALQKVFHMPNVAKLCRYYYTAFPLKKVLTEQYPQTIPREFPPLFDNSLAVKAKMFFEVLGDYKKTISYNEQVLETYSGMYGESKSHPDIVRSLNDLGSGWHGLGDDRKALGYLEQALQMCRSIYGTKTTHSEMARSLTNLGSAWQSLGDYRKAVMYHEQAMEAYSSIHSPKTEHTDIATSLNNLGSVLYSLGNYRRAIACHEQALEMYRSIHGRNTVHPDIATSLNNLGLVLLDVGDDRTAIKYFEQVLHMYNIMYNKSTDHPDIAIVLSNLGSAWQQLGNYRKAAGFHEQTLEMYRSIYGEGTAHPEMAKSLNNLGSVWAYLGDNRKTANYYEQALQMYRIIYGESTAHPRLAESLNSLGSVWGKLGDYRKAISYYEQALQMYRSIYGTDTAHPSIAGLLNNLGSAWSELEDFRRAISYYEQALQMNKIIYGEGLQHPDIAGSLNNMGNAWSEIGDFTKAIRYYEQALQMNRSIYGENTAHSAIAGSLNNLGSAWNEIRDFRKAVNYYDQALMMYKHIYGIEAHPNIAGLLNNLGLAWNGLGDHKKAVSYLNQAVQTHRMIYGEYTAHPDIAISLNNLGSVCKSLGDYRKAVRYFELSQQKYREIYGQSTAHPNIALTLGNLGSAWMHLRDDRKAISYFEQSLQMIRSIYGESNTHPDIVATLENLALAYNSLGNNRKAVNYHDLALKMKKRIYGESTPHPELDLDQLGDQSKTRKKVANTYQVLD